MLFLLKRPAFGHCRHCGKFMAKSLFSSATIINVALLVQSDNITILREHHVRSNNIAIG